jgi:hypothetical protein
MVRRPPIHDIARPTMYDAGGNRIKEYDLVVASQRLFLKDLGLVVYLGFPQ